eukprot:810640-Amphidinium_carterae.5
MNAPQGRAQVTKEDSCIGNRHECQKLSGHHAPNHQVLELSISRARIQTDWVRCVETHNNDLVYEKLIQIDGGPTSARPSQASQAASST